MTNSEIAARVIAIARDTYVRWTGETTAAFDYHIAVKRPDSTLSESALDHAISQIANPHEREWMAGQVIAGYSADECEARSRALREELADELAGFRAKCAARSYTGWSNGNGPIRYAGR